MNKLEIGASIEYSRPLPYYLASQCVQYIMGFVYGDGQIEDELRGLESFRQAVVKLVQEGLTLPEGCEELDPPYVRVKLTAGEDHLAPTLEYNLIVEVEHHETLDLWKIRHWNSDGDIHQYFLIPNAERAVEFLKTMLDHKTGKWASKVVFDGRAVDS
jgi:hypothetical protein